MARIRIIGINYAPESTGNAPYTTGLAEHLAANGHDVEVVTGLPHYPAWHITRGYGGRMTREEVRGGVSVRRRAHFVPSRPSALSRAAYEATFLLSALPASTEAGAEAVIGIVPSLSGGVLARLAAMRLRVPYGLLFQDLMGPAAAQSGTAGGGRVAGWTTVAETWCVANAAALAVVSDGFRPYLVEHGAAPERIHLVPNWSHVKPATADRHATRAELGWDDGRQVVLHAGNMGAKQGLDQVVVAARLADTRADPVRFVLLGDGNQRAALEVTAAGVRTLMFMPPVAERRFPDVLVAADVLLVSERATVKDMSLPSKLTSYAAAGRPIVAAVPAGGTTAHEVDRLGTLRTDPGDAEALLEVLARLRDHPDLAVRLGEAGPAYLARYLRPDAALARADAFVEAVLSAR